MWPPPESPVCVLCTTLVVGVNVYRTTQRLSQVSVAYWQGLVFSEPCDLSVPCCGGVFPRAATGGTPWLTVTGAALPMETTVWSVEGACWDGSAQNRQGRCYLSEDGASG